MPEVVAPKKEIGGIKREYVYAGAGVLVVLMGVVYYRSKKTANASASTVTDPAGNVCAALSPSSGYCPGTPQDLAYAGTGAGSLVGQNSASYVGGQIVGYDQYGNPIYSSSSSQTGVPGGFTNNAQWTQAAVQELMNDEPNANAATLTDALGVYINGVVPTAAQVSIIQQAIALEGYPPIGGSGGFPPGIKNPSTGTGGTSGGQAKNPVKGLHATAVNFDNVAVQWEKSDNATSYNVAITQGGKQIQKHSVSSTTDTLRGLKQKTRYTIRVWAAPDPTGGGNPASITVTTK